MPLSGSLRHSFHPRETEEQELACPERHRSSETPGVGRPSAPEPESLLPRELRHWRKVSRTSTEPTGRNSHTLLPTLQTAKPAKPLNRNRMGTSLKVKPLGEGINKQEKKILKSIKMVACDLQQIPIASFSSKPEGDGPRVLRSWGEGLSTPISVWNAIVFRGLGRWLSGKGHALLF